MQPPQPPANESERLATLIRYQILDTPAESEFDDLTSLASEICGVPIALISLLDGKRQWFKSKVGLDATETPREISFCGHAIHGRNVFEVSNALNDERFAANPLVTGAPDIRFYAGMPLITSSGHAMGTLCVIDRVERQLTPGQRIALERLARQATSQLELRLTNRLLAEQSAFQETLLASAAAAIISTTPEGVITHFNPEAEKMLGYQAGELIGKATPAAFHDPAEVFVRAEELTFELGSPVVPGYDVFTAKARAGCSETHEWTYIRKDGSRLPVILSVSALRDPAGNLTGFLGVARDISERRALEAQKDRSLKALADFKAALDEHAIVAITDPKGRITYVNEKFCAISKYSRDELLGQDHRIVNSEYHPKEFIAELWNTISAGRVWHGSIQNRAKDGSFYWVNTTIVPFVDEQGIPLQYIAIRSDITKEVELAREIDATNQELKDFAYVVSHDLKAPLRGIGTLACWLSEDYADKIDDAGREQLGLLTNRVKRLDSLVNGILAYSRAGRAREGLVKVNLDTLAHSVAEMLAPPEHIRFAFETALPSLLLEPSKAHQLFQNLFSNAIKFMDKPHGLISVRCRQQGNYWHFSVADNGQGIEEKYFDRIFELFQTLAPRDEIEGTGVGLALVKKIVELGGGTVWVESERGKGSTFHFTLRSAEPTQLSMPTP